VQDDRSPSPPPPASEGPARGHARIRQFRRRLVFKLLIAYVTPLAVLSFYFHVQYGQTIREGVENHLRSIAENQRNTLDLFLAERLANMNSVFRSDLIAGRSPQGGLPLVLEKLRRQSPDFVDVGLFDEAGRLVAYEGEFKSLLGKDYSGEEWFRRLRESGRDYLVSDVYLGFRGRPHFIIAIRQVAAGQPWILRASVDPEKFGEFVRGTYLGEAGESFLVNRDGVRQTAAGPRNGNERPPPRSPEIMVDETEVAGEEAFRSFAWLTHTDWALVVRVPSEQALVPLYRARRMVVAITLAALILIAILVWRNARSVERQIERADEARDDLQRQLFTAAKLASVGEMAAGVAHEINNPLAIIHEEAGMMLDLLDPQFAQKLDPEEFRERLRAITEASIRGRNITRKLLTFARKHDAEPVPTDLVPVVEAVLAMKEVEFKVSNIHVERDYEPGLPKILLNPNQIEQVLLNLLNNARDAMRQRQGVIVLRARRTGGEVHLAVEDNGCGMSEEQLEKVFFPFFTTKEVGKGTGLGLSISYGIMKSHGGRIDVESRIGHGSTFTIVFPVPESEAHV
jgi:two-component system NtrC family sensor kinase